MLVMGATEVGAPAVNVTVVNWLQVMRQSKRRSGAGSMV